MVAIRELVQIRWFAFRMKVILVRYMLATTTPRENPSPDGRKHNLSKKQSLDKGCPSRRNSLRSTVANVSITRRSHHAADFARYRCSQHRLGLPSVLSQQLGRRADGVVRKGRRRDPGVARRGSASVDSLRVAASQRTRPHGTRTSFDAAAARGFVRVASRFHPRSRHR